MIAIVYDHDMTKEEVLKNHPRPWKVVEKGTTYLLSLGDKFSAVTDDRAVLDANGVEVIGSSEWMRDEGALQLMVDLVNEHCPNVDLSSPIQKHWATYFTNDRLVQLNHYRHRANRPALTREEAVGMVIGMSGAEIKQIRDMLD